MFGFRRSETAARDLESQGVLKSQAVSERLDGFADAVQVQAMVVYYRYL